MASALESESRAYQAHALPLELCHRKWRFVGDSNAILAGTGRARHRIRLRTEMEDGIGIEPMIKWVAAIRLTVLANRPKIWCGQGGIEPPFLA